MERFVYLRGVSTLALDPGRCNGCGVCRKVCPHAVLTIESNSPRRARIADADACMECGACALNCPEGALTVQSGVGCANAVINSVFNKDKELCCGPPDAPGSTSTGCC